MVQSVLQFDGSAARTIKRSGIKALYRQGQQAPKQKRLAQLSRDQIEMLPKISVGSHRAVPLHLYYKAAHSLMDQADYLTAQVKALERDPKPGDQQQINRMKAACKELDKNAEVAKRLGYARRTRLQQVMAKAFPKEKRDTYLLASMILGFILSVLGTPNLIKTYLEWIKPKSDAKQKARDS